jgi:L-alanine-DL-glutamate epimerase-like enolase superfamily enzyme
MDLASAAVRRLEIPLEGSYAISDGATASIYSMLVVLETADGERGIGTADVTGNHPIPQTVDGIQSSLVDELLPAVLEEQPEHPNALHRLLDEFPHYGNAKCALEMAYLDLYCRRRGQSIADFLGGRLRDEEPLNAWVGVDTPEAMAAEADEWRRRGFTSLKMKADGDVQRDIARIEAVCDAVGDEMAVRVDANEGYGSLEEALETCRAIEDRPIAHFEQPLPRDDREGLVALTDATSVPIMADEPILRLQDAYDFLSAGAGDRLKFKILKQGGVVRVREMLDVARAAGVDCVVGHGFCTSPAASAELQLTATHGSVFRPVESVGTLKLADEPFTPRLSIEDGTATVPDGDGLSVTLADGDVLDGVTADAVELER